MNTTRIGFALLFLVGACDARDTADGHDAGPSGCAPGLADCDHDGVCETDITSPENCGGCGRACTVGPHATGTCSHGTCGITCSAGFGDCDAVGDNGCESDLTTPGTCGSCSNSCGGACENGACASCDAPLALASNDPLDAARALGLCGDSVISAKWVKADGTEPPSEGMPADAYQLGHGILADFGSHVAVREGARLLALSSGTARRPGDPGFNTPSGFDKGFTSASPAGFPRPSPACPGVEPSSTINDSAALELQLKAPDWAKGFAFDFDFYTYEWPNWVCSQYNDFFVSILSPVPAGQVDGDISFDTMGNPISVNAAFVSVCGCDTGPPCHAGGREFTCTKGVEELTGTGFDDDVAHAATSWLTTTAPVEPGQTITLRLAIYDSGDHVLDSTVLLDKFRWLPRSPVVATTPIE
jgi:hypothetical protein